MAKPASSCPAAISRSRMWRLTSASVRPDSRFGGDREHGPVRRGGRSPQPLDLVRAP